MIARSITASACVALCLAPSLAAAEVCDKIMGDNWHPEDGSGTAFAELKPTLYVILGVFAVAWLAWVAKARPVAWIAAGLAALNLGLRARDWMDRSAPFLQSAIQEGCWPTLNQQLANGAASLVICLFFLALAFRLPSAIERA